MKNKKKILGFDIDELIESSIQGLFESSMVDKTSAELDELLNQEKMEKAIGKQKQRFSKKGSNDKMSDEASAPSDTAQVKVKHEKIPDIDVKAIRNKIDNIRAGKSLKDSETKDALKAYFQKLNGPERIALFAFLSGLEKILGRAAKDVKTPHSDPYNVDMEAVKTSEEKVQPKGSKKVSKSETSDTPIIVGERANTRDIKAKLWRK